MLFNESFSCILVRRDTLDMERYGYKCYSMYKELECKVGMYLTWIYYSQVKSSFLGFLRVNTSGQNNINGIRISYL